MPFKQRHPLYATWSGMKQRCYNVKSEKYPHYGGRGVRVCDRWLHDLQAFAKDMGEKPVGYSIDRIDNNGDYTPENCRWSTRSQQARNRTNTLTVTIEGITYRATDLSDDVGVSVSVIVRRATRGLSYAEVVSPARTKRTRESIDRAIAARTKTCKERTHCNFGHPRTSNDYDRHGRFLCKTCVKIRMGKHITAPVPVPASVEA